MKLLFLNFNARNNYNNEYPLKRRRSETLTIRGGIDENVKLSPRMVSQSEAADVHVPRRTGCKIVLLFCLFLRAYRYVRRKIVAQDIR
uniref:Uncharacterized protein n=1 Tax=Glossina pallidipes TaxID=7398 RepID=A0A1A9ZTT8_GLOPL